MYDVCDVCACCVRMSVIDVCACVCMCVRNNIHTYTQDKQIIRTLLSLSHAYKTGIQSSNVHKYDTKAQTTGPLQFVGVSVCLVRVFSRIHVFTYRVWRASISAYLSIMLLSA